MRIHARPMKGATGRVRRLEQEAHPPRAEQAPVPEYFTLFLLQELLASLRFRQRH